MPSRSGNAIALGGDAQDFFGFSHLPPYFPISLSLSKG
jgi:hypothetical protein